MARRWESAADDLDAMVGQGHRGFHELHGTLEGLTAVGKVEQSWVFRSAAASGCRCENRFAGQI